MSSSPLPDKVIMSLRSLTSGSLPSSSAVDVDAGINKSSLLVSRLTKERSSKDIKRSVKGMNAPLPRQFHSYSVRLTA